MITDVDVRSVVAAFYRVLLMREPDSDGLDAHVAGVASGERTIDETLAAFFRSDEFRALMPRVQQAQAPNDKARFTNDHSQYGEFEILLRHWINEAARHRIVVDVGARGRERSNSFDLLRVFGWRGLLIEANPALIAGIDREFARLRFDLLNVAVSDYEGQADFHIGANDDVSSLNVGTARVWGETRGVISVPVRRLAPLLDAHGIPPDFDLLSLDIEGEDLRVLNDLVDSSDYRPRWIIIEASYDYQTRSLNDLDLTNKVRGAYRIVGQTPANLILKCGISSDLIPVS